jgi:hypothetical protein
MAYLVSIVVGSFGLILDSYALLTEIITFKIVPHGLVPTEGHHLELSLTPGIKSERAHRRVLHPEATMQA